MPPRKRPKPSPDEDGPKGEDFWRAQYPGLDGKQTSSGGVDRPADALERQRRELRAQREPSSGKTIEGPPVPHFDPYAVETMLGAVAVMKLLGRLRRKGKAHGDLREALGVVRFLPGTKRGQG